MHMYKRKIKKDPLEEVGLRMKQPFGACLGEAINALNKIAKEGDEHSKDLAIGALTAMFERVEK